jgi:hypothetical protein
MSATDLHPHKASSFRKLGVFLKQLNDLTVPKIASENIHPLSQSQGEGGNTHSRIAA